MFEKITNALKNFDADLDSLLEKFFRNYATTDNQLFFADNFSILSKVIIYCLFFLLPILFLKLLFPYKRILNWFIYLLLGISTISLFGILLGFIQLLYSF